MVLRIPEAGLELDSSPKAVSALPLQIFSVSLSDDVVADMIESYESGQSIELSLGPNPSFHYGSEVHNISKTPETFTYDVFSTQPKSSPEKATLHPNPVATLFRNPLLNKPSARYLPARHQPRQQQQQQPQQQGPPVEDEDEDEVIEIISNPDKSFKPSNSKSTSLQAQGVPPRKPKPAPKKGLVSNKGGSFTVSTSGRSHPSSPALSGIGSPSSEPTIETATQAVVKEAKEQRVPIIHALAVREMTYEELWEKWPGGEDTKKEFRNMLDKVADMDKSTQKYAMKKMFWKELDIWNYNYDNLEMDRQLAIENAVKQFDRIRLGASEPEWQKLLPFEERGKGKFLSRVQVNLAKGPKGLTPKIQVQKAEDSSPGDLSSNREDGNRSIRSVGSEPMSRSNSQTLPSKTKKTAEPKKATTTTKKATTPKVSPAKGASTKAGVKATTNGSRGPLSKEIITDSDSSSEEVPLAKTKKWRGAGATKPEVIRAPQPIVAPKPRIMAAPVQEPIKPQITARPIKRPRDDDDSSSSSGTPLSKKVKAKDVKVKEELPAREDKPMREIHAREERREIKAAVPMKHRVSDASQTSRGTSSGGSGQSSSSFNNGKPKNTSPIKSSPLASSPPTNASDLDPAEEAMIAKANANKSGPKKRKAADDAKEVGPKVKRSKPLPPDLISKARKFKFYYEKYEALHNELVAYAEPPKQEYQKLMHMRERLAEMKREIYEGTGEK